MNELHDREYFCDICGFVITKRQGWHHSYMGLNHWICEMIAARRKEGFHTDKIPVRKMLYGGPIQAQPVERKTKSAIKDNWDI